MSTTDPPATYPQQQVVYQPPPSNGVGLTGFIISLVGLIVCGGLLCPIGFIISLFGLKKEPRGFAIAGVVIGLVGSLAGLGLIFLVHSLHTNSLNIFNAFAMHPVTSGVMFNASFDIDHYYDQNNNTLPDEATGTTILSQYSDEWNTPLRYKPTTASTTDYQMISAGPDTQFGTHDDYIEPFTVHSNSMMHNSPSHYNDGPAESDIDFTFDQAAQAIHLAFPIGSSMPDQAAGKKAIAGLRDAWGREIQYHPTNNPPHYHLKSAGEDGVWQNEDDIIKSFYFDPISQP